MQKKGKNTHSCNASNAKRNTNTHTKKNKGDLALLRTSNWYSGKNELKTLPKSRFEHLLNLEFKDRDTNYNNNNSKDAINNASQNESSEIAEEISDFED